MPPSKRSPEVGCTCACLQLVYFTSCCPTKTLDERFEDALQLNKKLHFTNVMKINENTPNYEAFNSNIS